MKNLQKKWNTQGSYKTSHVMVSTCDCTTVLIYNVLYIVFCFESPGTTPEKLRHEHKDVTVDW